MIYYHQSLAAFLICLLASALSLSIPKNQQVTESNVFSLHNLSLATPSEHTMPPDIPGFEVRLSIDRNPTLNVLDIYSSAIKMMAWLATKPWDALIPYYHEIEGDNHQARVVMRPWPEASSVLLLAQHGVVGLYRAGYQLAKIPVTADSLLPRLYGGFFLQNQQIGFLKFSPATPLPGSEVNSTWGLVSAGIPTSALKSRFDEGLQTSPEDNSGTIVDPIDSSYTYNYQLKDGRVDLQESFSVFLEAIAAAALHPLNELGAVVNAVSVSGDIGVNLHGTGSSSQLPWSAVPKLFGLLWTDVIARELHLVAMDFEVLREGKIIGRGFMMNTKTARASLASS